MKSIKRYIYKAEFSEVDWNNIKGIICDDDYIYIVKDEEATSELRIVNVFLVPIIQKNWVMFKKYYFGKNHK